MNNQAVQEVKTMQLVRPTKMELDFDISQDAIEMMRLQFMPLTIINATDKMQYKAVEDAKRIVSMHRINVEKKRKEFKADALEHGRKVDTAAKSLTEQLEQIEAHLAAEKIKADQVLDKLKFEKAQKAKMAVRVQRLKMIEMHLEESELLELDDLAFEMKIATFTSEKINKAIIEQEARDQALRDAQEAKDKAIRAEQEEKERLAQKTLKEAQDKLDAERKAFEAEKLAKQREVELEEARKEAAEKAKKDAELEAIRKEEALKFAEKQAETDRLRIEAQKPDAEKLIIFAGKLREYLQLVPVVSTPWGTSRLLVVKKQLEEAIKYLSN